jgi:hypothetical protein
MYHLDSTFRIDSREKGRISKIVFEVFAVIETGWTMMVSVNMTS